LIRQKKSAPNPVQYQFSLRAISGTMERKKPRPRRSFTPEFKAQIVERCKRGDRSIGQVARDFDLGETAVRAWVIQARPMPVTGPV
jgi:hypothetical protein